MMKNTRNGKELREQHTERQKGKMHATGSRRSSEEEEEEEEEEEAEIEGRIRASASSTSSSVTFVLQRESV